MTYSKQLPEISSFYRTIVGEADGFRNQQGGHLSVVTLNAAELDKLSDEHCATDRNRKKWQRSVVGSSFGWGSMAMGGLQSLDESRNLFASGWKEGGERASMLRSTVEELVPTGTVPKRQRRSREDGDELRIEQAMRGDWDTAYWTTEKVETPAPNVVSITAGWIAMNYIPHEALIWNAVQAIILTDLLESSGFRVELRAVDIVQENNRDDLHVTQMVMKRPNEMLQPDLVAAVIGHGGVFRSLGFGAMLMHPTSTDSVLGHDPGRNVKQWALDECVKQGALDPISYRLPRADSQDAALNNITQALRDLNATIN